MDFLSADDVAALLRITRKRAYRALELGQVPAVKMGGRWRIPQAAWDRWYETQTAQRWPRYAARRARRLVPKQRSVKAVRMRVCGPKRVDPLSRARIVRHYAPDLDRQLQALQ